MKSRLGTGISLTFLTVQYTHWLVMQCLSHLCNIRTGRFLNNSIIGRSSDNFSELKLAVLTCRNPIIYKEFNFSLKQRILTAKILNCSILSSSRCLPYTPSTLPPSPPLPPSPTPQERREEVRMEA